MKKTLLLGSILFASVLVGCEKKYDSRSQAKTACYEWEMKGERIDYTITYPTYIETEEFQINRECKLEKETNQYLGYEGEFSSEDLEKEGKKVYFEFEPKPTNLKVVKNFRY